MAEASIQESVFRRIPEPLNQSYSLRCLHRVFPLDNNLLFLDFTVLRNNAIFRVNLRIR